MASGSGVVLRDSETLAQALKILEGMHVVVREDSMSPWIELDVDVRGYMSYRYAIWKQTDVLYALEDTGAVAEEPYDVERLAELRGLEGR